VQDTFYGGNMKGVGRVYQQTFVDTYSKVAFAKFYDRETPINAADLLNDRVVRRCHVIEKRTREFCIWNIFKRPLLRAPHFHSRRTKGSVRSC
jgi:hypothetical protein